MTTPIAAWKTQIGLERNPTDDTITETGVDIDGSTHTVLGGVTSKSITTDNGSTEISQLGEKGIRRLLGRKDATLDLDLNFDPTDDGSNATNHDGHQGLLQDDSDDVTYGVVIDFDKTTSDSFGIAFVGKVENFDISADDGELSASLSISNANGIKPLKKTIAGDLDALT